MLSRMLSRFNQLKTPDSDNLPSITRNFQLLEMEQVNTPRLLLFPLQRPFDRQFAHRCRRELESLEEPQAQGHQLPLLLNGAPRPQEYPSHRLAAQTLPDLQLLRRQRPQIPALPG